jgi:hypothetical protein
MEVRLERAMTPTSSALRPCAWCEEEFEAQPVMVTVAPHGYELCPECARAILKGERCGVRAKLGWPTWERYQEALGLYPEPMLASDEECARAEELGLYDDLFEMSFLDQELLP